MKNFNQSLESYCTALPLKTTSFKLRKNELLTPIEIGAEVLLKATMVDGIFDSDPKNFQFLIPIKNSSMIVFKIPSES